MSIETDGDIVNFFAWHIRNACINSDTGKPITEFYIKEAERAIPNIHDETARKDLQRVVDWAHIIYG